VQFLVEHFTVFGFEGQNWMLILIAVVAAFLFFVWTTRDRV
jgi:H+/gluconate symporter-like permease